MKNFHWIVTFEDDVLVLYMVLCNLIWLVESHSLGNPLKRMERLGPGWLGVIVDYEGVVVESSSQLHSQAWLVLAEEEAKPRPLQFKLLLSGLMKAEQVGVEFDQHEFVNIKAICLCGPFDFFYPSSSEGQVSSYSLLSELVFCLFQQLSARAYSNAANLPSVC